MQVFGSFRREVRKKSGFDAIVPSGGRGVCAAVRSVRVAALCSMTAATLDEAYIYDANYTSGRIHAKEDK